MGQEKLQAMIMLIMSLFNQPLLPQYPGNPTLTDPNRWQQLTLETFVDQSGNLIEGDTPEFLSPEWGDVKPFSLTNDDVKVHE